jgi:transposase
LGFSPADNVEPCKGSTDMTASASTFTHFLGFDVSKDKVTVFDSQSKSCLDVPNRFDDLVRFLKPFSAQTLAVCEATGGYERILLSALMAAGVPGHRADAVKVKAFIRSFRQGKSDAIDAKALARYAQERADTLALFCPSDENRVALSSLVERRRELVALRVAETNRSKAPMAQECAFSFKAMLKAIATQIKAVETRIQTLIASSVELKETIETLETIHGVGRITAIELASAMPELGAMTGKQTASLAGLAPHPRDSGTVHGKRFIRQGRRNAKPILFMAALAAAHSKSDLGTFYKGLVERGKKKIVAITALMRKIIVIANARIRDMKLQKQS